MVECPDPLEADPFDMDALDMDTLELGAVELLRVEVPLREPFVAMHGTETVRDVVIVRVTTGEGVEGWGECPTLARPTYTAEYTDGAWDLLQGHLIPALLVGDRVAPEGHPMASGAIGTALVDARLRSERRSLFAALGARSTELPTVAVVGVTYDIGDLVDKVSRHLDLGVAGVKLKIGPGRDVVPLEAVRERWPDLWLAADANCSYGDDPGAVPGAAFDELGLVYLEQPLHPGALQGSALLAASMSTPVAFDEAVTSPGDLGAVLDGGGARVVNVKPARMGGIGAAVDALVECAARGVDCFVGGMLETGIGRSAALAVAARSECTLPTDLGPSSRYFDDDVVPPIVTSPGGRVIVPTGPGTGVAPDRDHIERFVTRSVVFDIA